MYNIQGDPIKVDVKLIERSTAVVYKLVKMNKISEDW